MSNEPKYLGHVLRVKGLDGTQAFDIVGRAMQHSNGDIVIESYPFSGCPDMVIYQGSVVDAANRHKRRTAESLSNANKVEAD